MPITKRTELDQIIVEPELGTVLWRETIIIEEDGKELSRTYHRSSAMVDEADSLRIPDVVKPFRVMADTPAARSKVAANKAKGNK